MAKFSPNTSAAKHFAFLATKQPSERPAAFRRYLRRLSRKGKKERTAILGRFGKIKRERLEIAAKVQRIIRQAWKKFPGFEGVYFFGSLLTKGGKINDIDILPILRIAGKPRIIVCEQGLRDFLFSEITKATGIKTDGLETFYSQGKEMKQGLVAINALSEEDISTALLELKQFAFAKPKLRLNPNAVFAKKRTAMLFQRAVSGLKQQTK